MINDVVPSFKLEVEPDRLDRACHAWHFTLFFCGGCDPSDTKPGLGKHRTGRDEDNLKKYWKTGKIGGGARPLRLGRVSPKLHQEGGPPRKWDTLSKSHCREGCVLKK